MITYVYFVRFRVVTSSSGTLDEPVEGSLIMKRKKFVTTNKDLEDIERYVGRHAGGKAEILVLNLLHGLSDI